MTGSGCRKGSRYLCSILISSGADGEDATSSGVGSTFGTKFATGPGDGSNSTIGVTTGSGMVLLLDLALAVDLDQIRVSPQIRA